MTQTKNLINLLRSRPRVLIMGIIGFALIAVAPVLVATQSTSTDYSYCQEFPVPDENNDAAYIPSATGDFGIWKLHYGTAGEMTYGWADEEDSTIWSHIQCLTDPNYEPES